MAGYTVRTYALYFRECFVEAESEADAIAAVLDEDREIVYNRSEFIDEEPTIGILVEELKEKETAAMLREAGKTKIDEDGQEFVPSIAAVQLTPKE